MTEITKTQRKTLLPTGEDKAAGARRWYFVCPSCNAKWFHNLQRHACPRCGTVVVAADKIVPPWRR